MNCNSIRNSWLRFIENINVKLKKILGFLKKIRSSQWEIVPKIYQNSECNELYFYWCMVGGIMRTKKMKSTYKKWWLIYHVLSDIITLSSIAAYLLTVEERDLYTIFFSCHEIFVKLAVHFIYGAFMYYFEDVEQYTEQMDEYLKNLRAPCSSGGINKYRNLGYLLLLMPYSITIIGLMSKLLAPETNLTNNVYLYLHPFPSIIPVDSILVYLLISLVQTINAAHITFTIYSALKIRSLFITQAHYTYGALRVNLKIHSKWALTEMEKSHDRELNVEGQSIELRNRIAAKFDDRRNEITIQFDKAVAKIGKQHWELIKIQNKSKGIIECGCTIFVLIFFVLNIPLGSRVIGTLKNQTEFNGWSLFALNIILMTTFLLYKYLNIIETLEEESEKFSNQVYFTPWYLLPKRMRANIYILLVQTQHRDQFYIFKSIPLNTALIPRILNSCYSYILVVQTLIEKSKLH